MKTEHWQQIENVFQLALDCAPERRAGLLDLACRGNAELRAEVESLLAAYQQTGFTHNAAFADGFKLLEKSVAPQRGCRQIGPYRILRELGNGGMGAVYLAARADEVFEKFVALKIVRRGLDTEDSVQRFRSERKILATLEHPNITRLLDGGTTDDDLPYLVMEYVEGEPIDQYCDAHKLNITERLKLFQGVCAAVGYAHQNLIIHRDIKPGNVLVTKEGIPKLLDFGIAKLLALEPGSGEATITMARHRYLTPEYASPEQVRGQTITTATDVYSLGVVLYRLLCGRSPYAVRGLSTAEIERAICEVESEKPSLAVSHEPQPQTSDDHSSDTHSISATREGTPDKLRRRLEGDLDNIMLKALSKEPQRRYASVEQFSEDINRHLANVPVIARPDTPGYRAAKFIVRHRTGVAAAVLIVLSLIAGVVGTSWQARVARTERARAQEQFNDVRKLSTSFLFEFNNSIQSLPGATLARRLLIQRALEYLSKLAQQAQGDAGLQRELAEAYLKVGDLQGNPYEPNLGDSHGAAESYDRALAISAGLVQANARDGQARLYLARSYQSLGEVLPLSGNPVDGLKNLRKASEVFEESVSTEPGNRDLRKQLANCYQSLGDLQGHSGLQNLGDRAGALESYHKAIAIFDALAAEDGKDKTARRGGAVLRIRIGDMQQQGQGDLGAALENYRAALDRAESLAASDPKNERAQRLLALSYRKMADVLNQTNEFKLALQNAFKATDINERLAAADPDNAQARMNFALSLATEAELFHKTGMRSDALGKYREATGILEKLSTAAPADVFIRGQLSGSLIATGGVLAETGKSAEAHGYTSRGLSIARDLANRGNATPDEMSRYALALITCQPHDLRQPAAALENAKRAVEKSGSHDPNSLDVLAQAYFQNRDLTHAIESEKEALKLLPASPPGETVSLIRHKMQGRLTSFEARQKGTDYHGRN